MSNWQYQSWLCYTRFPALGASNRNFSLKIDWLIWISAVSWLGEPKPFMTSSQAFYKNFSSKSDWLIWLSVPVAIGGRNNSRFKLLTRLLFSWRFTYLTIKSAFSWSNLFWSSMNSWTFSRNCSSVYKRGDNIRNKNTYVNLWSPKDWIAQQK